LSDLCPVGNMTFNYVVKAKQDGDYSVVIKFAIDESYIADEIRSLCNFGGS
jgi:hypothetical protein